MQKERESFYQNQIETMQRLLEAPKPYTTSSIDTESPQANATPAQPEPGTTEPKDNGLTADEPKRIPIPKQVEVEPEKEVSGVGFPAEWLRLCCTKI